MKTLYARPLLAAILTATLVGGPISPAFAQDAPQNPQAAQAKPATAIVPVSLGTAKYNYTRAPKPFPNLFAPYSPIKIPAPVLTNSPRIDQLIHEGKIELSMQEAVELALENSLDIVVQRYNPWFADTGILKANAGGFGGTTPGAVFGGSSANNPLLNFDPVVTTVLTLDDRKSPINNPLTSGTGTGISSLAALATHTSIFNVQYAQGFATGTTFFTAWDNTRNSASLSANLFNPSVQTTIFAGLQQQLLNGFGRSVGTRNIRIAKTNRKIADCAFTQQAITTITNAIAAYWELVFARENVKVQQQAVTVAEKLSNDNKKQLEIGTMAPLDVTRSESELATDRQNLVVAQTVQLQDQQTLKNAISKNPLAPNFVNVEIIPTDLPSRPEAIEAPTFEDAVKEAFAKRPELQEEALNLLNSQIDLKATRNALLPTSTTPTLHSPKIAPRSMPPVRRASCNSKPLMRNRRGILSELRPCTSSFKRNATSSTRKARNFALSPTSPKPRPITSAPSAARSKSIASPSPMPSLERPNARRSFPARYTVKSLVRTNSFSTPDKNNLLKNNLFKRSFCSARGNFPGPSFLFLSPRIRTVPVTR